MANDTASLLLGYYQANGATSDDLQDAEREFLIGQGVTVAANQDMWYELLIALGYSGSLPDMLHDFWCTGGGVIGGTYWNTAMTDRWDTPMTDLWDTPMNTEAP